MPAELAIANELASTNFFMGGDRRRNVNSSYFSGSYLDQAKCAEMGQK